MSDETPEAPPLGRRERAKQEKRARILAAAAELFASRGYSGASTQEIADAADVGAGTLFRYFPTKADLLVEVMTQDIRDGITRAVESTDFGADPAAAIVALITPLAEAGAEQPENIAVFLRETLFGAPNLRAVGVAHGMAMPAAIEQILQGYAKEHPVRAGVDLRDIADAIYAMVWLEGLRTITQGQEIKTGRVEHVVDFLLRGLLLADE